MGARLASGVSSSINPRRRAIETMIELRRDVQCFSSVYMHLVIHRTWRFGVVTLPGLLYLNSTTFETGGRRDVGQFSSVAVPASMHVTPQNKDKSMDSYLAMENYAGIEQKLVYTIISNRNTATVKMVGVW